MIVSVTLTGEKELVYRLTQMPEVVQRALELKVRMLALKLEAKVKTQKLNGQVLNRISGALARSIANKVISVQGVIYGRVFSSGDVKYAGIHEYGGVINHPGGTAYIPGATGKMQFVSNANADASMPRTKAHTIKMPERSFLRSSLRDMSTEISLGMKKAVIQAIQKQVQG